MEQTKWLVCRQTTYNCVKYQTSDGDTKYPSYNEFLTLMMKYSVKDPFEFKKYIDMFKPLYIDLTTGDWNEVELGRDLNVPFSTLCDLNIEKEKTNTLLNEVDKGKKFIFRRKKK